MSHPDLETFQQWMITVITHPGTIEEAADAGQPCLGSTSVRELIAGDSVLERLGVYHHAYFARIEECLADDFPAVRKAVGEAVFSRLCREYITRCPSASPSLNFTGAGFPGFLRESPDLQDPRFFSELAALEWALVEVIHAQNIEHQLARPLKGRGDLNAKEKRLAGTPPSTPQDTPHRGNLWRPDSSSGHG